MTRTPIYLATLAAGILVALAGSAGAAPDVLSLPIDQVAPVSDSVASGTTHVPPVTDVTVPPTTDTAPASHDSPEPATLALLGLGGLGAWWHSRRRKADAPSEANG